MPLTESSSEQPGGFARAGITDNRLSATTVVKALTRESRRMKQQG